MLIVMILKCAGLVYNATSILCTLSGKFFVYLFQTCCMSFNSITLVFNMFNVLSLIEILRPSRLVTILD